jgi:hypothetical protein
MTFVPIMSKNSAQTSRYVREVSFFQKVNSDANRVTLRNVNLGSTGRYRYIKTNTQAGNHN